MAGTEAEALDSFGRPDVLHDNGIWLRHNHRLAELAARNCIPRVVSTRGMLEPWAMNYKRWKKSIAWSLYQKRDLRRVDYVHATAELEARNVKRLELDVPVVVIPNGVDVPEARPKITGIERERGARGQRKTALFLGRIHPKKGLLMLVEAWAQVRPDGWQLKIAGPDEDEHRSQVENAVSTMRLNDVISFIGPVDGEAKQSTFFDSDLFVLPTYSENFGTVVAEALAHRLPVLTTTGTPWSMLPEQGCGWCVAPTVEGIAEGLQEATSQKYGTLQTMGTKGCAFVATEFGWDFIAKKFIATYERLLERSPLI
jgi:glycosyltransferase involved in cell wall biosynthesis